MRKLLETKCYPHTGAQKEVGVSQALDGVVLAAGHAGDTETNPLLSHPRKLAQLPEAFLRGRAQAPALHRVAGVSPQTQGTKSNRESTPQIRNIQPFNSQTSGNCGSLEADSSGGGPAAPLAPSRSTARSASPNR